MRDNLSISIFEFDFCGELVRSEGILSIKIFSREWNPFSFLVQWRRLILFHVDISHMDHDETRVEKFEILEFHKCDRLDILARWELDGLRRDRQAVVLVGKLVHFGQIVKNFLHLFLEGGHYGLIFLLVRDVVREIFLRPHRKRSPGIGRVWGEVHIKDWIIRNFSRLQIFRNFDVNIDSVCQYLQQDL